MKKSMKTAQKIGAVLTVMWMVMIFLFSAQPAEDSSQVSSEVTEVIMHTANTIFHLELNPKAIYRLIEQWEKPVRKMAHATEYFVLTCFLMLWFWKGSAQLWKTAGLAAVVAIGYATTDELHQLFVPGRSCQLLDVGIDSLGMLVALAVIVGVNKLCTNSLWNKNKYKENISSSQELT